MHHVCYEVDDITAARDRLRDAGPAGYSAAVSRRSGLMAKRFCSCHPKEFGGTLIELKQS